ncbi:MAG: CoA transferase, partial [Pseudomonadota bacterium]
FYALLLDGLGLSDAALPDQNDRASWPDMTARFADIFARHPRDHWADVFSGTDACVAPVLSMDEAAKDTHLSPRGTYVDVNGVRQSAPAPRFSNAPAGPVPAPTAPGAQTEAILTELGYDAAAIRALRDGGVCT